jgi:hypothetical protein
VFDEVVLDEEFAKGLRIEKIVFLIGEKFASPEGLDRLPQKHMRWGD